MHNRQVSNKHIMTGCYDRQTPNKVVFTRVTLDSSKIDGTTFTWTDKPLVDIALYSKMRQNTKIKFNKIYTDHSHTVITVFQHCSFTPKQ